MFLTNLLHVFIALDVLAIFALIYRIFEVFVKENFPNETEMSEIILEQDNIIASYEDIFEFQRNYINNLHKFYAGELTEEEIIKFLESAKQETEGIIK